MLDYALTSLIPLSLALVVLWNSKSSEGQGIFMNKDYTSVLKGACCIIVIMVHIHAAHVNKLQDAIGSFAYIGVTLFFMMSAYGMSLSLDRKQSYMSHFWRNRLASLLVPQLLINATSLIYSVLIGNSGGVKMLLSINPYVLVLLQYCLWFYLVWLGRKFYDKCVADALLVVGVIVSSMVNYFMAYPDATSSSTAAWPFERWGLVWGILLFAYFNPIKGFIGFKWNKAVLFGLLSILLGGCYIKFKTEFFWGEYVLKIILGLVIILFLFILSSKRSLGNKAAFFLSEISYEVYLSHGFIMLVLDNACPNVSSGVYILLTVTLTIAFSTVIHYMGKPIVKAIRV